MDIFVAQSTIFCPHSIMGAIWIYISIEMQIIGLFLYFLILLLITFFISPIYSICIFAVLNKNFKSICFIDFNLWESIKISVNTNKETISCNKTIHQTCIVRLLTPSSILFVGLVVQSEPNAESPLSEMIMFCAVDGRYDCWFCWLLLELPSEETPLLPPLLPWLVKEGWGL